MTAAIFITLEIAALTMLNNNGPIQRSWFGKIGQGFMGWVWGSTQKVSDYFSLKEQNDALAAENYRLTLLLADQKDSLFRDSLSRMVPPDNIAGDFIYIPAGISKISSRESAFLPTLHNFFCKFSFSFPKNCERSGVVPVLSWVDGRSIAGKLRICDHSIISFIEK